MEGLARLQMNALLIHIEESDRTKHELLIKAQSYDKPTMSVDDRTDPLTISCRIPESVTTDVTCNLYTEDGPLRYMSGKHICQFFINHGEIFPHKQTVSSRQLSCDYSIKTDLRSPRSDVYTIRGLPQAVLRASSSVITDTDTVQMDCMNRENQKMDTCFFTVDGMESNMKESRSCHLSLTGSDIIHWSGGQRSSVIITCFYSVYESPVLMSSPQSDPVTVTVESSTSTITAQTTPTTLMTTYMWITPLSAAGCSVLTGLMCYCMGRYICKSTFVSLHMVV
ncbi:hypothetical protein IRJ41_010550 [Triplophysa rosa]|uniref:Uncharacterized protein n=1 Tax=Triplophysa rosa TaxID=992332 RepID=A0A9W7TEB0_TRIRA|nr:hypothetical protein IRJ41_010550 [Triplophysa rosa]